MAADGSVIIEVEIDESGVNKGIKSVKNQFGGLESSIKRLGGVIAGAFSVAALVRFGQTAIGLASDLQEVQNVVDVSFGDMSYKIENFAKTAIESFGISQLTAKRTASTYMAMAKGIGIAEDVGSDMAITLTGLTADMASFYNVSQEMADTAIKSIFTGETESLKQYGIVMTEVNLEQYALSQGIKKSLSAMTQQEKTMLRYGYVMEQTNLAQGDFARTQDSFANKTRTLTERWKEMQAVFGETLIILADGFLPVLEVIVEKLTIVALYIAAFARAMSGSSKEIQQATNDNKDLSDQTDKAGQSIQSTTGAIKDLGKETGKTNKQLAQFDELMILQSGSAPTLSNDAIIGNLDGIISPNIKDELSALQSFLDDETMKNLQNFEKWVSDNKDGIKTALEIAGLVLLGLKIASVSKGIGRLLNIFKRKDKGLDTQTKKTRTETSAVGDLSNEYSLAGAAALLLIPVLGGLSRSSGKLTPSFEKATESAHDLSPALDENLAAAYDLSPALDANVASAYDLSPAMDDAAESTSKLTPALAAATDTVPELTPELDLARDAISKFESATAAAMPKVKRNIEGATESASTNLNSFSKQTEENLGKWAANVALIFMLTSGLWATNVYRSLNSAGKNITDFINKTSPNFALWGENMSFTIVKTAENIDTSFGEALESAWLNFKNFMIATGQAISGFWKKNKATILTVGAFAGLAVAGIALAPYTGGASLMLPALAEGAVIPPNHEFMAVLGDQKSGTNIETPLSTMIDAFKIAMQDMNMGGGQTVVMQIDGREFGRFVNKYGVQESNRIGVSLAGGVR